MSSTKDKSLKWWGLAGFLTVFLVLGSVAYFSDDGVLHQASYGDLTEHQESRQRVVYGETYQIPIGEDTLSHQLIIEEWGGRKYTPECLTDCHLPIRISASQMKELIYGSNLKGYFYNTYGDDASSCINDWGFDVAVEKTEQIPLYETNCETLTNTYTAKNGTKVTEETQECSETKIGEKTKEWIEWQPITGKIDLQASKYYVIDQWAVKKPNCVVDAVPELFNEKLPYAWWNASYSYKSNFSCWTNSSSFASPWCYLNGTSGLDTASLISASKMQANCQDVRVLYNQIEVPFSLDYCNSASTVIRLNSTIPISADNNYEIYYACPSCSATNITDIYGSVYSAVWVMDGDNGTALDRSGNNHGATNTGVTYGNGYIGGGWTFGTANSDLAVASGSEESFDFGTDPVTMGSWFKSGGSAGGQARWFWKYAGGNDGWYAYTEAPSDGCTGSPYVNFEGCIGCFNSCTGTNNGQWHHLTVRKSGTNLTAFLDGKNCGNIVCSSDSNSGEQFRLGGDGGATSLNGTMDEAFFMKGYALPDNEIVRIYEIGKSRVLAEEQASQANSTWGAYNLVISPVSPFTTSPINASWSIDNNVTLDNGTVVVYSIVANETKWFVDNILNTTFANFTQIPSSATTKGEQWKFSARLNNGTGWSSWSLNSTVATVQNSAPTLPDQNLPVNNYISSVTSVIFNCTNSTDADGDVITYVFANNTATMGNSTGSLNYTFDSNTTVSWHCWADDGDGKVSSMTGNRSLTVDTSGIKAVFEGHNAASQGSNTFLRFNVSFNNVTIVNVTATLTYNGTSYTPSRYAFNSTFTLFNATAYVPFGSDSYTYEWNITAALVGGGTLNSKYSYTHTLRPFSFGVCSAINGTSVLVANLTVIDEVNETRIDNSTIKATFEIWGSDASAKFNKNLDISRANISTYLCVSPNNTLYRTDALIEYVASGYDTRRFYYVNQSLNSTANNSVSTNLSLLLISLGTGVTFTVQDEAETPYINDYIYIDRYDAGKNIYRTVAMGRTDDNGQDYIYLRLYDTLYRYRVQSNGNIAFTSEKAVIKAINQVITITEGGWAGEIADLDRPSLDLTFDNDTSTFTLTFTSSETATVCLSVHKNNLTYSGMQTDTCTTGTTGTLTYTIDTDSAIWTGTGYVKGSVYIKKLEIIDKIQRNVGATKNALIVGLLIMISMVFVGLWSETAAVISGFMALLILYPLGFVNFTSVAFVSLGIATIIIVLGFKR